VTSRRLYRAAGRIRHARRVFRSFSPGPQTRFPRQALRLLNVAGYYDRMLAMLDHAVAERLLRPAHRELVIADTDPLRLLQRLSTFPSLQKESVATRRGTFCNRRIKLPGYIDTVFRGTLRIQSRSASRTSAVFKPERKMTMKKHLAIHDFNDAAGGRGYGCRNRAAPDPDAGSRQEDGGGMRSQSQTGRAGDEHRHPGFRRESETFLPHGRLVPESIEIAQLKASTSAGLPFSTKQIGEIAAKVPGIAFVPGIVTFEGGLPILTGDGKHIGSIGVSGASAEQDGMCAQAGLDAVKNDLK